MKIVPNLLIVIAILASGCSSRHAREGSRIHSEAVPPLGENFLINWCKGKEVYQRYGCFVCHGEDGRGTPRAPELWNLGDTWKVDELEKYLKDPSGYTAQSERLTALRKKYMPLTMPVFSFSQEEEFHALVNYLLRINYNIVSYCSPSAQEN